MDEFTDDDESQIFDEFEDEYPFEISMPPDDLVDNSNNDENNEETSTIGNSEAFYTEEEVKKILEEFSLESFSQVIIRLNFKARMNFFFLFKRN